jgi:hypothetical protein
VRKSAFRPVGLKIPGVLGTAAAVGFKALDVMDVKNRAAKATERLKRTQTPSISGAIPVNNVAANPPMKFACIVVREGDHYTCRTSKGVSKIAVSSNIGQDLAEFLGDDNEAAIFGERGAVLFKEATDLGSTVGKVIAGAGAAALGATIFQAGGAVVGAAARGVGSIFERSRRENLFKEVLRLDPSLKSNPRVREYFDLIMTYAPSLGDHPTAIGDFLRRQLQYPVSGIEFLNSLATFEKTVGQSRMNNVSSGLGHGFSEHGAGYLSHGIGEALKPQKPQKAH